MEIWKQFEENKITHSAAHHLLAVMNLKKDRGYARVTDVAKYLDITTGSASTNLKNLKQKGLISEDDNKFLVLTKHGEALARAVIARKEIFKKFLTQFLHVSEKQAEIDACKTEHLLSHETSERLLAFIRLLSDKCAVDWEKLEPEMIKSAKALAVCTEKNGDPTHCNICSDVCLMQEC